MKLPAFPCLILCFSLMVYGQSYYGDTCIDEYTKTVGKCTDVEICKSAKEDLTNNNIKPTFCSFNFNSVLVCCRDGTTILQTEPPKKNSGSPNTGERVSKRKCKEYSASVVQVVDFLTLVPDSDVMSVSGPKCDYVGTELVIGGEDARLGEFPHMALIGWSSQGEFQFDCGGSLISRRFVLTAGHCTFNPRADNPVPTVVRLGDHNLNPAVKDGAHPVDIPIKQVHNHPEYRPPFKYNDIALVELATDVDFSKNIRPACLWTQPHFAGKEKAIVTGWGVYDIRTRRKSEELQKASISILSNAYCNTALSGFIGRNWPDGMVASQMCAGELRGGKDTCEGDSGGPLQIVSENNQCIFHIIGVTSFGPSQCGKEPGVYTRVSSYLDWIESVVWTNE